MNDFPASIGRIRTLTIVTACPDMVLASIGYYLTVT
jgi:hypothetical protein